MISSSGAVQELREEGSKQKCRCKGPGAEREHHHASENSQKKSQWTMCEAEAGGGYGQRGGRCS